MIGFYVHHHGSGHLARTRSVIDVLDEPAALLTSIDVDPAVLPAGTELIRLPLDHLPDRRRHIGNINGSSNVGGNGAGTHDAHGALHWAPVGTGELKARSSALVRWLTRPDAELLVVDMSVEVLVQARLCGVRTVAVRSNGSRSDRVHRLGYDCADALLAPYPLELEDRTTAPELLKRTFHAGLYSRASGRCLAGDEARLQTGLDRARNVLVICVGSGGHTLPFEDIRLLSTVLPGWTIRVVGATGAPSTDGAVEFVGWVDDLFPWLRAATVVVGNTSANLTAEIAVANRPFIGIAEPRPHGEQTSRAELLAAAGAAVTMERWPALTQWPALIEAATGLGSEVLARWASNGHPDAVAQWLTVDRSGRSVSKPCGS